MTKKEHTEHTARSYHSILERVKHTFEAAEEKTRPTLEHAIKVARDKAVELGEISSEEAEKLGDYIKRDITDIAEHLNTSGSEFKNWLRIDIDLIEANLLDLMLQVADKTRVELSNLANRAQQANSYRTGEITGPGALVCKHCGEQLQFTKPGHIPPCPKCHKTEFKRAKV